MSSGSSLPSFIASFLSWMMGDKKALALRRCSKTVLSSGMKYCAIGLRYVCQLFNFLTAWKRSTVYIVLA